MNANDAYPYVIISAEKYNRLPPPTKELTPWSDDFVFGGRIGEYDLEKSPFKEHDVILVDYEGTFYKAVVCSIQTLNFPSSHISIIYRVSLLLNGRWAFESVGVGENEIRRGYENGARNIPTRHRPPPNFRTKPVEWSDWNFFDDTEADALLKNPPFIKNDVIYVALEGGAKRARVNSYRVKPNEHGGFRLVYSVSVEFGFGWSSDVIEVWSKMIDHGYEIAGRN